MLMYEELNNEGKKECRKKLVKQLQKKEKNNTISEANNATELLKQVGEISSLGIGMMADITTVITSPLWDVFATAFQK